MGFTTPLAPMFGPVVGGWLTGVASWHWLFLINLVPGLLIALAVWRLVDFDKPDWKLWKTVDIQGVVSMAVFLGTLEWVLEEGPEKGWFQSSVIGFWASVSLVAAVVFFTRVLTYAHPIIDLKLFRDRNFALANGAAMLISAPLLGANYILPLFLGSVRGFDSIQIGNTLMISGVAMFFAMPFVAKAARSVDLRLLFIVGCAILGFGVWSMGNLTVQTGSAELAWPLALRAIGILFALTACSTISLSMLPADSVKVGSAMYSLVRNMGGALGLAGINTVLAYRSAAHATALASTLDPSRAAVRDAMVANAGNELWYAELAHRIHVQVQVLAFNDALRFLLLLVVLASPLLLLSRRAVPDPARDAHEI
jgi:DHA2 family multidrug resistance protein